MASTGRRVPPWVIVISAGLDVSTTATKALLLDDAGTRACAVDRPRTPTRRRARCGASRTPACGGAGAVRRSRRRSTRPASGPRPSHAIGLTGQMHGLVLLDDRRRGPAPGHPVERPAHRRPSATKIRARVGRERLIAITGNDALTGFTAPKLLWVRRHEPESSRAIAHVLLPKDYVRSRLSGDYAMDCADGSGTMLFDLAARDWSAEVLDALGIPPGWLPPIYEGPYGHRHDHRGPPPATGLRAGTPVVAGGGDQAAEAVGVGAVAPGIVAALARHVGRGLRRHREPRRRARGPAACLLPRRARPLAFHGRHALGGRQPALVPRCAGARRRLRGARRRGRAGPGRERGPAVPALPHRRAHPAPRSAGPGRVRGSDRRHGRRT